MFKGKGILTASVAILIAALWMVCGRYAAAEAVYPLENGRNWFVRNLVVPFKAVFSASETALENRRLREELLFLCYRLQRRLRSWNRSNRVYRSQ